MDHHLLSWCLVALVFLGPWLWSRSKQQRRNPQGLPLPPGPRGLPFIGNVFDMPTSKEWVTVTEWKRQFGDIVYVENWGQPTIYLNTYSDTFELLEKRSVIYSDRPRFNMLTEIMDWGWAMTFTPYGDKFRKGRMFLSQFMNQTAVKDYTELQTKETYRLLGSILEAPNDFIYHLRRTAASIIMMAVYGHQVSRSGRDVFIDLADTALATVSTPGIAGHYLIDYFPWLKHVPAWFPGAGFKRQGKEWAKLSQSLLWTPYNMTKDRIKRGEVPPSILSRLLDEYTDENGHIEDEYSIAAVTSESYGAGSGSTLSTQLTAILAMVLFPEVVKRAHEELDSVVGKGRLPTFEDRPCLPYIEGIVSEAQRWANVAPLSTAHRVMTDDVYKGYFIPAGSAIIPNVWAIHHDEDEYPEPSVFKPERWIVEEGQEAPRHSTKCSWGFGRRVCPGRYFADNSVFIAIACLLAVFNIEKARDEVGNPITPTGEYRSGLLSIPDPFECSITPRSAEAAALIRQAVEHLQ